MRKPSENFSFRHICICKSPSNYPIPFPDLLESQSCDAPFYVTELIQHGPVSSSPKYKTHKPSTQDNGTHLHMRNYRNVINLNIPNDPKNMGLFPLPHMHVFRFIREPKPSQSANRSRPQTKLDYNCSSSSQVIPRRAATLNRFNLPLRTHSHKRHRQANHRVIVSVPKLLLFFHFLRPPTIHVRIRNGSSSSSLPEEHSYSVLLFTKHLSTIGHWLTTERNRVPFHPLLSVGLRPLLFLKGDSPCRANKSCRRN